MFTYLLSADHCLSSLQRKLNSSSHTHNFAFISTFAATIQRKTPPTPSLTWHATPWSAIWARRVAGKRGWRRRMGWAPRQRARLVRAENLLWLLQSILSTCCSTDSRKGSEPASAAVSQACFVSAGIVQRVCKTACSMQPQHTHTCTHTHMHTHLHKQTRP